MGRLLRDGPVIAAWSQCLRPSVSSDTTVVVILTSVFFGVYLFALDFGLLKLVQWIFRLFGVAGPTA